LAVERGEKKGSAHGGRKKGHLKRGNPGGVPVVNPSGGGGGRGYIVALQKGGKPSSSSSGGKRVGAAKRKKLTWLRLYGELGQKRKGGESEAQSGSGPNRPVSFFFHGREEGKKPSKSRILRAEAAWWKKKGEREPKFPGPLKKGGGGGAQGGKGKFPILQAWRGEKKKRGKRGKGRKRERL